MPTSYFLKSILAVFLSLFFIYSAAQENLPIAWISGDDTWNQGPNGSPLQAGVYGQKGVASNSNQPGARSFSVSWTDANGNLWLFGGIGYDKDGKNGSLNDLWKYNTVTKQWTWMSGSNQISQSGVYGSRGIVSTLSLPGARNQSMSWTDNKGNLWLYGGRGFDRNGSSGWLNDLWRYDIANNVWVWMSGNELSNSTGNYGTKGTSSSSNFPGARSWAMTWTDIGGNLWMFGGQGFSRIGIGSMNDLWRYNTTTNQWTWISGSDVTSQVGIYGTKDQFAASNTPGARIEAVSWTDASGILWLFGGQGVGKETGTGYLNDLWKFNTTTGQWAWVGGSDVRNQSGVYGAKGVQNAENIPGSRMYAKGWTDTKGNIWLYGGVGYPKTTTLVGLGDLWRYNIASNQWTWINGTEQGNEVTNYGVKGVSSSLNVVGLRSGSSSWIDNKGMMWLFGGNTRNDLWRYDVDLNQWTWESGLSIYNKAGVYGTKGTASETNLPGARSSSITFSDSTGSIWMFGGSGIDKNGTNGVLNDLWKFNTSNSQWIWVGGSDEVNQFGNYGVLGVVYSSGIPGARSTSVSWVDNKGVFWLFGGSGYDKNGRSGSLNDLWKYNPSINQWTWVSGSDTTNQFGKYGTRNTGDPLNVPGARIQSVTWTDAQGNLWVFGGTGYDKNGRSGSLNDLWKYSVSNNQWTWISGADTTNQIGKYGSKGIGDVNNVPGARAQALSWIDRDGIFWMFGGRGLGKDANLNGYLDDLWKFDVSSNQWTWVSGSNIINQTSDGSSPASRSRSVGWSDNKNNLWLFGGSTTIGSLNDIWKYNIKDTGWVYIKGQNTTPNEPGQYGEKGSPSNFNLPGARYSSMTWTDKNGDVWIYGGNGTDKNGVSGQLNDLWRVYLCQNAVKPKFNFGNSILCSSDQNPIQLKIINLNKGDDVEWIYRELPFYSKSDWNYFISDFDNLDSNILLSKLSKVILDSSKQSFIDAKLIHVVKEDSVGCQTESDPILIVKAAPPTKPIVKDVIYCQGSNTVELTASASNDHLLNWYGTLATGGTPTTLPPLPSTAISDTISYYVSQTSSITYCESDRSLLKVIVNPLPQTPVLSRQGNIISSDLPGIIWYKNDTVLSDTLQKYNATSNGIYSAVLKQNNCTSQMSNKIRYLNSAVLESVKSGNRVDTLTWIIKDTSTVKWIKIYRDTIANPSKILDSVEYKKLAYIDSNNLLLNTKYYYKLLVLDKEGSESDFSNVLFGVPKNASPISVKLVSKDFYEIGEINFIKTSFSSSGSRDTDGKIVKIEWYINDTLKSNTDTLYEYKFPQGTTHVKLIVTDNDGSKDSSVCSVKVVAFTKQLGGGIFGGLSALSRDVIYVTDTTNTPEYGSNIFKINRLGKTQLQLSVGAKVYNTPSLTVDSSLLITNGINFNGFNKSGVPLWPTFPLGGITKVTPTIDSVHSKIYLGVSNRNFIAVDYKTGKPVWSFLSDAPINSSAVITGNRKLVFTSQSGTLYAFDILKDTVQLNPKWKYPIGEIVTKSAAVDLSSNLYMGTTKGNLIKLKLNNDSTVTKLWSTSLSDSIDCSPVIDANGFVYIGTNGGSLNKVDPNTGKVVWTFKTNGAIKSTPAITEFGSIIFANINGQVFALDTSKNIKWKYETSSAITANILYIDNMVYVGTETGLLTGIYDNPKTSTLASVVDNRITQMESQMNNLFSIGGGILNGSNNKLNSNEIKLPIWGTFQGNYRRSGSQAIECPSKPFISSQLNTYTFCQGDSIKLNAPSISDKYTWFSKSGTIKSVTSNSLTVKNAEDIYLVQTNIYGCSVVSDTVSLKVKSLPNAPVITRDAEGNLVSSLTSGLTWFRDNSKISDTTQRIKPTVNGNYSLKVTVDGCSSLMSANYFYLSTSLANLYNGEYFVVSPNPSSGSISIVYKLSNPKTVSLTVIDMNGKAVYLSKKIHSGDKINLSGLSNGLYILQFVDQFGKLVNVQKLIKY